MHSNNSSLLCMIMISFKASKVKEQEIKRKAFSLNKEEYIIFSNKVPLPKKKKKNYKRNPKF